VTEDGNLLFTEDLQGVVSHAALAGGENVLGAGKVSFKMSEAGEFGIEAINAMSGHYLGTAATAVDTQAAIDAGLAAFEEYGIFLIF
jgi:hypothetical protein